VEVFAWKSFAKYPQVRKAARIFPVFSTGLAITPFPGALRERPGQTLGQEVHKFFTLNRFSAKAQHMRRGLLAVN
jgi:hypothetical protein